MAIKTEPEMDEVKPQIHDAIKLEDLETQPEPPPKKRKAPTTPKKTEKWTDEQTKFLCTLRKQGHSLPCRP
jgi:hypothetical protein